MRQDEMDGSKRQGGRGQKGAGRVFLLIIGVLMLSGLSEQSYTTFYTKSSNLILQWPGRGRTMGINEGEIDGAKRNLIVGPFLFNLWHILTC